MIYSHALVCIDFRATEAVALLGRAARLLTGSGRMTVLSVIEVGIFESGGEAVASLVEEEYHARTAHLTRLCAEMDHPRLEQRVLVGKAAAEIAAYAGANGCDLVVLGEHEDDGRPPGLGGTADAALKRLECDALVVKTSAMATPPAADCL